MAAATTFLLLLIAAASKANFAQAADSSSPALDFEATFGNWSGDAKTFINDYESKCKPYTREISTCLAGNQAANQTARDDAGQRYWRCTANYATREWFDCEKYEDYTVAKLPFGQAPETTPLNLTLDDNCKYPDPSPIIYQHCKDKLTGITGSKCCNATAPTKECKKRGSAFQSCVSFAVVQYIRCSEEFRSDPSSNATEACVSDNISRDKWPIEAFTWQAGAGARCKSPKRVIGLLAGSNAIAFLSALLLNVPFMKYVFSNKEKWEELKHREVRISFLRMVITTGTQLSVPILIGHILYWQGYGNKARVWWQVFVWGLRPRSAFLVGLLGLVHPMWMETALDEMVADLLFSLVGGAWAIATLIMYDKNVGPGGLNAYYLAGCGLILFSVLCVILTILRVFFSLKALLIALTGVFLAIRELVARLVNLYRKMRGRKERMQLTKTASWADIKGTYRLLLVGGCFLYIGGWMVWATVLTMAGRLYCPADLAAVAATLFVYPIILNIVRAVLGYQ